MVSILDFESWRKNWIIWLTWSVFAGVGAPAMAWNERNLEIILRR